MSEHKASLHWKREGGDFEYKTYSRNHLVRFENGATLEASAAAAYLGDASKVDPEQAFVASLASCHMLTFLALASFRKFVVDSYDDEAVGFLGKNQQGKMAITRIELHPKITFAEGKAPSAEELEALHHKAHEECFLANTVNCPIETVIE